jgi:hypothetical protein
MSDNPMLTASASRPSFPSPDRESEYLDNANVSLAAMSCTLSARIQVARSLVTGEIAMPIDPTGVFFCAWLRAADLWNSSCFGSFLLSARALATAVAFVDLQAMTKDISRLGADELLQIRARVSGLGILLDPIPDVIYQRASTLAIDLQHLQHWLSEVPRLPITPIEVNEVPRYCPVAVHIADMPQIPDAVRHRHVIFTRVSATIKSTSNQWLSSHWKFTDILILM